ncbi:TolC family protein [Variovorax robiniae]|uniref:TolC family protein n=1 Tax=Variovorax robiniae TaxID=1836199 RepID=A0ABU8XCS5_9BURK
MNFRAAIAVVSCLLGSFLPIETVRAQALEVLVRSALDSNPKVLAARSTARASNFEVTQAQAAWSPRVDLVADPGRSTGVTGSGSVQSGDIGLRGSQLLYDGGKSDAEIDRQKARLTASEQRVIVSAEQIGGQIADLYLEALKQSKLASVAADNVAAHQDLVKRVEDIVAVDRGRGSELTQTQARLEQARISFQQRQSASVEASAQVANLVSRPAVQILPVRDAAAVAPQSEAVAGVLLKSHPAILAADADAAAASQAAKIAAAWNMPRVDLQTSLQRGTSYQSGGSSSPVVDVRLAARWTGYDGGGSQAAASAAAEQAQAALNSSDALLQELTSEVIRNLQAIATRKARIATWSLLVAQLTSVKDGYWEQFKIGRRSILDLLNVQSEIFQAASSAESDRMEIAQSQYRLLTATAQLNAFLGLTVDVPTRPSRN